MSFWNSGPNHQTAGVAIFLKKDFEGKLQNMNTIMQEEFSLYSFYYTNNCFK